MKKLKELRFLTIKELQTELVNVRKEQFNARFKKAMGTLEKNHVLKSMKITIARIKTLISEKAGIIDG